MAGRKANRKFGGFKNPGDVRTRNRAIVRYEGKKKPVNTQGCTGETCSCE